MGVPFAERRTDILRVRLVAVEAFCGIHVNLWRRSPERMNHALRSQPTVAEVSSAGKRPSLSISVPNAICTLLDVVAVKVISALKRRVAVCRGGNGTSVDASHPEWGGGWLVMAVMSA